MTMQFISHRFPEYHDPTIEDAYKTQVRIDDEPAYLDILDTAGQAEFTAMRDQYMRGGEGFIICYSITDRQSFQEAAEFKELIYRVRHTYDIPLVLVGNKIDLEEFRQVSKSSAVSGLIIDFLPKSDCDKTLMVIIQLQFNTQLETSNNSAMCNMEYNLCSFWGTYIPDGGGMWIQLFCRVNRTLHLIPTEIAYD
ncbi:PREDICTED: GTP-binding protein Rit2 [Pterocles gutturalis]|uniref:GTP-binding protein Rit2 n=1 Tax=Pterocles gutturalis TaxID=240206 RepID=UPI0005281D79|nr:PREDICTED: GTP-binding protein Rit2 [Pterocles gutturalis]